MSRNQWSLVGIENNSSKSEQIWKGFVGQSPSAKLLESLLSVEFNDDILTDITAQILRNGDSKTLIDLLNSLCCNYWRNDTEKVGSDKISVFLEAKNRAVCGVLFKKGSVVWTCKECAKDPTCVQCDDCFRKSEHEGHEVYFHKATGGGGCCDCGDPEAWADSGNCTDHCCRGNHDIDELMSSIPPELNRGLKATIKGILGFVISFVVNSVRGFIPWESNLFVDPQQWPNEVLTARLHNDDVHTYDDVINALKFIGMTHERASTLTSAVDLEGHALIRDDKAESLRPIYQHLSRTCGLMLSTVPSRICEYSSKVDIAMSWLLQLGTANDGFKRIITESVLIDISTLLPTTSVILDMSLISSLSPNLIFQNTAQFPYTIPYIPDEIAGGADNTRSIKNPFQDCPQQCLPVLMIASPFLTKSLKKSINDMAVLFQHDELFKQSFSQYLTILYPTINFLYCRGIGTSADSIFNTTVQVYTANSVVNLLSSDGTHLRPYQEHNPTTITKMLTSTLLLAIYDFGCTATRTNDSFLDSQFIAHRRIWHICRDIEYVLESFTSAVRVLSGCRDHGALDDWLRLCSTLQLLDRYSSMMISLHSSILAMQSYDVMKYGFIRRFGTHIEHEDNRWQMAANLILDFEAVSTSFIGAALYPNTKKLSNEELLNKVELCQRALDYTVRRSFRQLTAWSSTAYTGTHPLLGEHDKESTVLGFHGKLENECTFKVSSERLSIHIPLHRFISKTLLYAAYNNMSISIRDYFRDNPSTSTVYVEYPLRCLVFAMQVHLGLWRRNGASAANLSYNYTRIPLCRSLRDFDLVALQAAIVGIGPQPVLALMIRRFEILPLLVTNVEQRNSTGNEFIGGMFAELLRLLSLIVSVVPVPLQDGPATGSPSGDNLSYLQQALSRVLVHLILGGANKMGALQVAKSLVGRDDTVGDEDMQAVVETICHRKETEDGGPTTLELKEQWLDAFDPEYLYMTATQLQNATETIRKKRKKEEEVLLAKKSKKQVPPPPPRPYFHSKAIISPQTSFQPLYSILYCPLFFALLENALKLSLMKTADQILGAGVRARLTARVIYLLTASFHCYEQTLQTQSYYDNVDNNTASNQHYIATLFTKGFSKNGVAYGLLEALVALWKSNSTAFDEMLKEGLDWLLYRLNSVSPAAATYFHEHDVNLHCFPSLPAAATPTSTVPMEVVNDATVATNSSNKRLEAQRRAMEAMTKQAKSFADRMIHDEDDADDEGGVEDSDVEGGLAASHEATPTTTGLGTTAATATSSGKESSKKISFEDASSECIFCHQKTGDPIGYLSLLQPSCVISSILNQCSDCPELKSVYRVVGVTGCPVMDSLTTDATELFRIPAGEHVRLGRRQGLYLALLGEPDLDVRASMSSTTSSSSPRTSGKETAGSNYKEIGWCPLFTVVSRKPSFMAESSGSEPEGGSPSSHITINLHPVSSLRFRKHGEARLFASRCGHMMHFKCYDGYYASSFVSSFSRSVTAVDAQRGEVLCPLCKSLTNTLVPYTPRHIAKQGFFATTAAVSDTSSTDSSPLTTPSISSKESVFSKSDHSYSPENYIRDLFPFNTQLLNNLTESSSMESNKKILFTHGQTFAECCLQQYQLPFRKKVGLDLKQGCPVFVQMRSLHSLWSCLGYTLLSSNHAQKWLLSDKGNNATAGCVGVTEDPKTIEFGAQIFLTARSASHWLAEELSEVVVGQLRQLLSGATKPKTMEDVDSILVESTSGCENILPCRLINISSCSKAECEEVQLTLPARVVGMPDFPSPKRILTTLNTCRSKGVPEPKLWPILQQPLLQQDLHVIAVAAVCCVSTASAAVESLAVLALARFGQLLVEPACNGSLPGASSASLTTRLVSLPNDSQLQLPVELLDRLETLRNNVCGHAKIPVSAAAPTGMLLLRVVIDSWVPFLQFLSLLRHVVLTAAKPNANDTTVTTDDDIGTKERLVEDGTGELQGLLRVLGLPPLRVMLESQNTVATVGQWAEQLASIDTCSMSILDNSSQKSSPASSWIPPLVTESVLRQYMNQRQVAREGSPTTGTGTGNNTLRIRKTYALESASNVDEHDDNMDVTMMSGQEDAAVTGNLISVNDDELSIIQQIMGDASDVPAELSAMLASISHLSDFSTSSNSSSSSTSNQITKWTLIGIDPVNSHIDGHHPDYLGRKSTRLGLMHSVTPLLGSVCGTRPIYGINCQRLKHGFSDVSHYGLGMRHCLKPVTLPYLYTDLYQKFKFPVELNGASLEEPAVCLVCGQMLFAANRHSESRASPDAGECTLHSRICGYGIGIFFLVQICRCLLVRGSRSCYYPSLYVDRDGEVEDSRLHNRPLFLCTKRYKKLMDLYVNHKIAVEVIRRRTSEERIVRENWY